MQGQHIETASQCKTIAHHPVYILAVPLRGEDPPQIRARSVERGKVLIGQIRGERHVPQTSHALAFENVLRLVRRHHILHRRDHLGRSQTRGSLCQIRIHSEGRSRKLQGKYVSVVDAAVEMPDRSIDSYASGVGRYLRLAARVDVGRFAAGRGVRFMRLSCCELLEERHHRLQKIDANR